MKFDVTILGANSAKFAHGRHQTSQLVCHNEHLFLLDCGEGTQLQLMRYRLKMSRINQIFITHLHGDHFLGLLGLILTLHLNGRTQRLEVFGPPGLDEILAVQLRWSETALSFPLIVTPVPAGPSRIIWENEHLEVLTIPLEHRIPCNGYFFREKQGKRRLVASAIDTYGLRPQHIAMVRRGEDVYADTGELLIDHRHVTLPPHPRRSYAFCSDTRLLPQNAALLQGADLLYHEATFLHEQQDRAAATFHTTARQAAEFATQAQARQLIIGHFSSRYRELAPLLDEARTYFASTHLAEEGVTFDIPYPDQEADASSAAASPKAEPVQA